MVRGKPRTLLVLKVEMNANDLIQALISPSPLAELLVSTPDLSRGNFDAFASSTTSYRPSGS